MEHKTFISQLINDVTNIKSEAEDNFSYLSEEQLDWKPTSKEWSISQNLTHLNLTTGLYLESIREAIKMGKNTDERPKGFHYSLMGKWFIQLMKPNARLSLKAFKPIQPGPDGEGSKSLSDFYDSQDQLLTFLKEAYDVDLVKNRVQSPVMSFFKMRLGEAFEAVIVHEKRHLKQAQQVFKHVDFPVSNQAESYLSV